MVDSGEVRLPFCGNHRTSPELRQSCSNTGPELGRVTKLLSWRILVRRALPGRSLDYGSRCSSLGSLVDSLELGFVHEAREQTYESTPQPRARKVSLP